MSTSQPPRQLQPEPTDPTNETKPSTTGRRRFAPVPIETCYRSSKQVDGPVRHPTEENCDNVFRKPETKKSRKVGNNAQGHPVVTKKDGGANAKGTTPRRFAVEPIEMSHTTSKNRGAVGQEAKPRPRFSPQLVETSERAGRRGGEDRQDSSASDSSRSARKFSPQLIETAARSRKAGHEGPAVLHSDRTDAFRNERRALKQNSSDSLEGTAYGDPKSVSAEVAESRRLGRPLPRPLPRRQSSGASTRSHSYHVPDLEPIESSESERSNMENESSASRSTSPSIGSDASSSEKLSERATCMRESADAQDGGYLLELAARAAEKQMREQALAAFPNDDRHRPVDHYIDNEDEDTYMSDAWSVTEYDGSNGRYITINWEMREMQKHAIDKAMAKKKERVRKEAWREFNRQTSANSPWGDAAAALYSTIGKDGKEAIGGWKEQAGLAKMRNSARPPMLGSDLSFPRCPSPEPARFDVTQTSETIRRNISESGLQNKATANQSKGGLWVAKKSDDEDSTALWSMEEDKPKPDKGLWSGFCVGTGSTPPRGPTGLMTPFIHPEDLEAMEAHKQGLHQLPPSPPPSNPGTSSLDEKLEIERAIEEEFDDAFVTQVYNYLSLGYPSMARKFDMELAKISRLDLDDLRADDAIVGAGARGYIRLGEENGVSPVNEEGEVIKEEHCARWRALKLYVKEWARQQPTWQQNGYGGGVAMRKGSWAW